MITLVWPWALAALPLPLPLPQLARLLPPPSRELADLVGHWIQLHRHPAAASAPGGQRP